MAELAAEAARLLRMREKDILSLRLLRRSVDAREEEMCIRDRRVTAKEIMAWRGEMQRRRAAIAPKQEHL